MKILDQKFNFIDMVSMLKLGYCARRPTHPDKFYIGLNEYNNLSNRDGISGAICISYEDVVAIDWQLCVPNDRVAKDVIYNELKSMIQKNDVPDGLKETVIWDILNGK